MASIPVFIVDDNPMFARLLQVRIASTGKYEVHVFPSGEKCLSHLHLKPQVLLLDYQLGGEDALNGRQVFRVLRECPWGPKVIFMSGQPDIERELLEAGGVAFISKDKDAFAKLDAVLATLLPPAAAEQA